MFNRITKMTMTKFKASDIFFHHSRYWLLRPKSSQFCWELFRSIDIYKQIFLSFNNIRCRWRFWLFSLIIFPAELSSDCDGRSWILIEEFWSWSVSERWISAWVVPIGGRRCPPPGRQPGPCRRPAASPPFSTKASRVSCKEQVASLELMECFLYKAISFFKRLMM